MASATARDIFFSLWMCCWLLCCWFTTDFMVKSIITHDGRSPSITCVFSIGLLTDCCAWGHWIYQHHYAWKHLKQKKKKTFKKKILQKWCWIDPRKDACESGGWEKKIKLYFKWEFRGHMTETCFRFSLLCVDVHESIEVPQMLTGALHVHVSNTLTHKCSIENCMYS